jgi:hypothetical protein
MTAIRKQMARRFRQQAKRVVLRRQEPPRFRGSQGWETW